MCNIYMHKQKVVFVSLLEAWTVYTGKYKTELWLGEGLKRREKKEVRRMKQYGSAS